MRCPQCVEKGEKSQVFPGSSMTTLMSYQPYFDEKGKYHHHDENTTTTDYRCSRGHEWHESTKGSCWCGWAA